MIETFVWLIFGTILTTSIALSAEVYLDARHLKKGTAQDKPGQMPWRIVSVGYSIIVSNLLVLGTPTETSSGIWRMWSIIGQIMLSMGWYWLAIDALMAKKLNQKWTFVGTTAKTDREFFKTHLTYKSILMGFGVLMLFTYCIITFA